MVKRLIEQRRIFGKSRATGSRDSGQQPSADSYVNAYRREAQRQKALVRRATVAEERLVFIVAALKDLIADENFVNLLRVENLGTMPEYLAERIKEEPTS